jgi:hypothetical protein
MDGSDEDRAPAKIFVKTTYSALKNAVSGLATLKAAMQKPSPKGYCEKYVTSLTSISNRRLCGGKTARNIGFWYKITFTVGKDGDKYEFRLPNDFGKGGVTILDGQIMKKFDRDMWASGKATQLNF